MPYFRTVAMPASADITVVVVVTVGVLELVVVVVAVDVDVTSVAQYCRTHARHYCPTRMRRDAWQVSVLHARSGARSASISQRLPRRDGLVLTDEFGLGELAV